jgi:hypothetical protein
MSSPISDFGIMSHIYPHADEIKALKYVYDRTSPEDYVYIGTTDHSRASVHSLRCYWILGRKIGVKNHVLNPGLTTESLIQKKMIQDLIRNDVEWIILWDNKHFIYWSKETLQGANDLDAYLHNNFNLIQRYGQFVVIQRK